MSRKHSTLLKEEVDDEENSSGSDGVGKKREKDKDGEYKKKKAYKKGDKNEGYFNDSMTKTSRVIGGAAVNPSAEAVTSPVHTQQPGVIPVPLQPPPSNRHQNQQNYAPATAGNVQTYAAAAQGHVQVPVHTVNAAATSNWQQQQAMLQRLPPPPGTQHVQMPQQYQVQPATALPQSQFATQNVTASQRQVYQGHPQPPQQQGQVYQPAPPQQQVYQAPPSQQQGQNYQAPLPQQQGQVYQPPPPQQPGQSYQAPPTQQGQNYQAPPPQQGQNFQAPPPQQQGQIYQGPPPQQQGQNYQGPTPQQGFYAVGVVGYPGGALVHQNIAHGQVPHSQGPQSPTGQVHDPNWQQYAQSDGNWSGHPNDGSWTGQPIPPDQQRDGNWAAFDGSPPEKTPQKPARKEITWRESPDNSSSGEEIESNDDDDDEEQQGLIRPPSPSKSTSSVEEEHETSPWQILAEQYEYYTKQFRRLQPNDGGVIKGPKARDFFLKSNLSTEILSKVWHLSDINQDNALDLDEFCIAMHLVVAIRHGLDLPAVLPYELLHHRQVSNDLQAGKVSEDSTDTIEEESKPLSHAQRNRSQSDTSLNEDHHPEMISRKTSMPLTKVDDEGRTQSPDQNVKIPRPKATNISLIDSRPGQLLPPPQPGQYPSWTPTKAGHDSDSAESDDDDSEKSTDDEDEPRPLSPGQTVAPLPMPSLTEDETKEEDDEEEGIPTPPSTPKDETPQPVFPDVAQVTRRLSKKSGARPRSAGDVNDIEHLPSSDGSAGSTPTNSSIGSDGKKEPPPPPPRRKEKGHSRSSSLDLNKLFGPKSKETRASTFGSPTSSQSSHTSQSGEVALPLKTEPKQEEDDTDAQTADDNEETIEKPAKAENFADFSNFENLVKAQGTASDSHMNVPSQGRTHRRSLSLDQAQDHWPKTSQTNNIDSTIDNTTKNQEALPRPVPKLKPPVSPPVKLLTLNKQTPRKDGNEERKLKTEPPKVVVKPLTKESKLQNSIRELKETNLLLSRLNSELQQENTEMMKQRITLEHKLERLKPFTST